MLPEPAPATPGLRVLLVASALTRPALIGALEGNGDVVMLAPVEHTRREIDRGGVDVVLMALGAAGSLRVLLDLQHRSGTPVIAVAREGGSATARLLAAGVDDCVPWDASPYELQLRLARATVFAARGHTPVAVVSGPFSVDLERRVCQVDGRMIHLAPKELGLLALLMGKDGRVVDRHEALASVWGSSGTEDMTTVDVHVKRLRAKVERDPANPVHLLTVRGMGYRFQA